MGEMGRIGEEVGVNGGVMIDVTFTTRPAGDRAGRASFWKVHFVALEFIL
jgi:hypothetical protein